MSFIKAKKSRIEATRLEVLEAPKGQNLQRGTLAGANGRRNAPGR